MARSYPSKIKSYSHRNYQNPFFGRRKRRVVFRNISWQKKLIATGLLVAIGGVVWLLFFNEWFNITTITVTGSNASGQQKIYDLASQQADRQPNIFLFNKKKLRSQILREYYVDNLRIDKIWPRTLRVTFQERPSVAMWSEQDAYYLVDNDWRIISETTLPATLRPTAVILKNITPNEAKITEIDEVRRVDVPIDYLNFSLKLAEILLKLPITTTHVFTVNEPESTISVAINPGPIIYFSTQTDVAQQCANLQTLLQTKVTGDKLKQLQYIDLRFGDKIYYK